VVRAADRGHVPAGAREATSSLRGDRILHEALTIGPDPLHLAMVFNLSHTIANRYAAIAQNLLDDQLGHAAEP